MSYFQYTWCIRFRSFHTFAELSIINYYINTPGTQAKSPVFSSVSLRKTSILTVCVAIERAFSVSLKMVLVHHLISNNSPLVVCFIACGGGFGNWINANALLVESSTHTAIQTDRTDGLQYSRGVVGPRERATWKASRLLIGWGILQLRWRSSPPLQ